MPDADALQVGGLSVAGVETCIEVPRWKLAFDLGRCPLSAVNLPTVLFTHAHMDHMGGVAWHCATRALRRMPPPRYVVGPEAAEAFADLFAVWRRLDQSDLPHETVVLGPGDEWELDRETVVRPFRSIHRIACQGYALWSRKQKLRAEYAGLPGEEIARLRKEGLAVTELVETPELAFTGDTRIEVVEREEVVRTARLLVLEVTFLDERVSVEECREKGHVHLDEVLERAALFENEHVVLTHVSARYRREEILAILERRLPPGLRERVTPLLTGHR
jgi:ribonuclease Z